MKNLFGITLTLLIATFLAAQPADLGRLPLPQDPELLTGQLENGLDYYIMRNPKPANIAEMRLYVEAGSVDEDEDQRGLAHFTEHMAFNGTRNFARSEVVEYLSSIGMGYYNGLNAMTSYDFTAYTFKIPTDDEAKLRQGLLILSDMAHQLSFDPDEIERERGVIIEEWRMGQNAASRVRDTQNAVFLAGSRYAERAPIGTHEVISGFEHDTIKRFYQDWYRPDLQSVVIVGDFEPQDMLALVEEYFGAIPAREDPRPRGSYEVPDNIEPQAVVATDREYSRNMLNVMWKKEVQPVQNVGDYRESLKRDLFYDMLNTRLEEHSKKPDPPFSYVGAYEYPMLRTMSTAAVVALFNEGKAEEALSTILKEAERVQRKGFLPTEFERAKIDLLRRAEKSVAEKDTRESRQIAWGIIEAIANDNVYIAPEQASQLVSALLETISLEEVNAIVADLIQEKNMFISIGAPEKEGFTYPTEERLLEIARTTSKMDIEPYVDKVIDEPIISRIPEPRPLKDESYDPATDVHIWTLANGVKVYGKKTDFKNDEVLLSAVSPGGISQFSEDDILAAKLVSGYFGESGFGNFDAVSLDKALVGKVADASLQLNFGSEGFRASCSPKDLELMFQLVHQYGTNPRFDAQDFQTYVQRTKTMLENEDLEPMNVFFRRMYSEMFGGNPYMRSLNEFDLNEAEISEIEWIFRDRFADFSDFSFIIVGNYDEEQLKEFSRIYLANLPASNREEKPRDVGLEPSSGQREVRFNKGASDRCFAAHITGGDYAPSVQNQVLLDGLEHVLNEKLRENIREALSGVYLIQSGIQVSELPDPKYSLLTFMACSPDRVDELSTAIFATLDSLRAGKLDEKYVVAARATLQQRFDEDINSNRYWLGSIRDSVWRKVPLDGFLATLDLISRLDKDALVGAANSYADFDENKLSVVMLPEEQEE
ncbi:MAG: M16 family metallopeptidase [Candidatus Syntrophosphaera sp.]